MKQNKSSKQLVISIIFLLGVSIGILHRNKIKVVTHASFSSYSAQELMHKKPEEIVDLIHPFLESHHIDLSVDVLKKVSFSILLDTLRLLFKEDKDIIFTEEKIKIIYALAQDISDEKARYHLFDLMLEDESIIKSTSLLLVAASGEYKGIISYILAWLDKRSTQYHMKLYGKDRLIEDALYMTISLNDAALLESLCLNGLTLTTEQASRLLWQVIHEHKDVAFVSFLLKQGADIHYIGPDQQSLLTKAIILKENKLIRALLDDADSPKVNINSIELPMIAEKEYSDYYPLFQTFKNVK